MLLTRSPLGPKTSFDLHVLGTLPAFILSQDQTLQNKRGQKPLVEDVRRLARFMALATLMLLVWNQQVPCKLVFNVLRISEEREETS